MILIATLLCLALQRFANMGGWLQPSWFDLYLKSLKPWIIKLNEWLAILVVIVPILLLLALLQFILSGRMFGLFNLLLATLVLFFCIDARDFKNKLASYFIGIEKNDKQAATEAVSDFVGDVTNSISELNRAVTKSILLNSFENLFSGLFWFMLFGIYGVTTYLLIVLLCKNALKIDSDYSGIAQLATQIQGILDWFPSRLLGISYALVGHFNHGSSYVGRNFWSGITEIKNFSVEAGLAALDVDPDASKATIKENYAVLDLINRTLIIWLMGLSLVLLGSLL